LVERLKTNCRQTVCDYTAVNNLGLSITKDLDPAAVVSLSQGGIQKIDAGGLVRLEHPDWRMEITSGKGNIQSLLDELNKAEKQVMAKLDHHGAADVAEAREVNGVYELHAKEVETHKSILSAELGEDSFERLKSQVDALGKEAAVRSLEELP
jgi:hypothetical protein